MEYSNIAQSTAAADQGAVKTIRLRKLKIPYPPVNEYVADNQETADLWTDFMAKATASDSRNNLEGKKVHVLNPANLQYDTTEDENIDFVDWDTGELVGVVRYNCFWDLKLLTVVDNAVIDHCNVTTATIRKDNPRLLKSTGYTLGSRSHPCITPARKKLDMSDQYRGSHAYRMVCVMNLIWSVIVPLLPEKIKADFESGRLKLDVLSMDGGARDPDIVLKFTVLIGGVEKNLEIAAKAPASGVCGINYGRYVHKETNLNRWCVGFSTSCTHDPSIGTSFYNSSYGYRIRSCASQMRGWQGGLNHATSLLKVEPNDKYPNVRFTAVAFILSNSLVTGLAIEKEKGLKIVPLVQLKVQTVLDDTPVVPKPRATMRHIKHTKDRSNIQYVKNRIETIIIPDLHLPAQEAYAKMTIATLKASYLVKRADNMALEAFRSSWKKERLVAESLRADGVDVTITYSDPPRKAEEQNDVPGLDTEADVPQTSWLLVGNINGGRLYVVKK